VFLSRGCLSSWEGVESNRASASFSVIFPLASVSMISVFKVDVESNRASASFSMIFVLASVTMISMFEVDSFEWSHDDRA